MNGEIVFSHIRHTIYRIKKMSESFPRVNPWYSESTTEYLSLWFALVLLSSSYGIWQNHRNLAGVHKFQWILLMILVKYNILGSFETFIYKKIEKFIKNNFYFQKKKFKLFQNKSLLLFIIEITSINKTK